MVRIHPGLEDYYLWIQMLMNGTRFANIAESLVFVRVENVFERRRGVQYFKKEIKFL